MNQPTTHQTDWLRPRMIAAAYLIGMDHARKDREVDDEYLSGGNIDLSLDCHNEIAEECGRNPGGHPSLAFARSVVSIDDLIEEYERGFDDYRPT